MRRRAATSSARAFPRCSSPSTKRFAAWWGFPPIEHGGEDGFAEVLLPPGITDKQMEQAQLLFGALRIGFSDIAEQYPAYFRLTTRKVH